LLSIAYSTILVIYYTKIVTLKITGFPIIIAYKIRVVSFKITGFIITVIKLRGFFKRTISAYMAGK